MVDAAGAIYVIGGRSSTGTDYFHDVWASTDGGARAGLGPGGMVGGRSGVLKGYLGELGGITGYHGSMRVAKVKEAVLRGMPGLCGTRGVLRGV